MNYYKYPQRLLKKLNSESGVTLTILVITIVVLLIIASIVLVNSNAGSEQRALNNMYNDIRALDGKIAVYYEKNKELPVLYDESGKAKVALYFEKYDELKPEYDKSIDKTVIKQQLRDTERNINDNEVYYVIDTSKLDNINLSYAERENEEYTYVINEKSHTIYYLPGVALKDATYYKLPIEYEDIIVNQKYTVKYVVNGTVVQKTGNLNYGDKTPSAPEVTDIEEGYAFVGWMPESDKTIVLKSEDIEEILVEHDETYTAQIKDKNQEITYDLFGGENNENNTEGYIIGERKEILNPAYVQKGRNFENEEDTSGIDYTLNEENLEKCDEYIFDGWYLDKDYKIELPKDSEENYYIPEEGIYPNTILYAKWSAPAAKVIYNEMQPVYEFNYTGDVQEFIVPADGTYKIEAWGAAGGYSLNNNKKGSQGGNGGYTSGKIELKRGEILYIYVGKKGEDGTYQKDSEASFNGGGLGTWDHEDDEAAGAGGGATDIRLVSGEWNDFESLKSRIMVAGGGGGASWNTKGGSAGGLTGYIANKNTIAGSQTGGYKFGIGQDGYGTGDSDGVAGAGGGYYGGTASDSHYSTVYESAAGGSSFISGHEGCDAIDELSTEDNIIHTSQNIHYSGRKFTNTEMIDGEDSNMPSKDGEGTITGNSENGYVKITLTEDYIETEEYYGTLYEAIKDCKNNEEEATQIVILRDISEVNEIDENKNILIDLNGRTISSIKPTITVKNGTLTIVDKLHKNGTIVSEKGVAIDINENGILNLGIDDKDVWTTSPIIEGENYGVNNKGTFNYYDGKIIGKIAINGEVNDLPYLKNPGITNINNKQVATLVTIVDAEATIGKKTFNKLESAIAYANTKIAEDGSQVEIVIVKELLKENDIAVSKDKNIKLNLNGFLITLKACINNKGNLEIVDTTENNAGKITSDITTPIINENNLIISSGNITGTSSATVAIENKEKGKIIVNGGNVNSVNYAIVSNDTSTVVVNGGTLKAYGAIKLNNTSNLVVNDGTLSGTKWGTINVYSTGNIEINGGNIISSEDDTIIQNTPAVITVNGGILQARKQGIHSLVTAEIVIKGGTIQGGDAGIYNEKDSKINILGGNIKTIKNFAKGNITIDDGTIEGSYMAIQNRASGTITINGGNVYAKDWEAIENYSNGTIIVNGGTIQGRSAISDKNSAGTIIVTGGNLIGTYSSESCGGIYIDIYKEGNSGTVKISGGTIVGASYGIKNSLSSKMIITGGNIVGNNNSGIYNDSGDIILGEKDGKVQQEQLAISGKIYGVYSKSGTIYLYDGNFVGETDKSIAGYIGEKEENTYLNIEEIENLKEKAYLSDKVKVAAIGTTEYFSLQEAIDASLQGDTIKLLKNIAVVDELVCGESKKIKLDLCGYKILTYKNIINNGEIEIIDTSENVTGTIISSKEVINNNKLVINSIKVKVSVAETPIINQGNLEINSGSITGETYGVKLQENGTLKMTGGEITGTNYGIYNETAGNIEILGGTVKASIGIYNNVEGKVTIENATIGTCGKYGIHNKAGGKIEINSGEVIAHGSYDRGILNEGDGTVIINDGTISSQGNYSSGSWSYYEYPGITIDNQGTGLVEINGGVIKQIGIGTSTINNKNGTIRVTGGTIEKANNKYGIENEESGTVQIEGGTLTSAGIGIYNEKTEGVITMTGGTITSKEDGINNINAGSITITGGTITSENKIGINNASTGKVVIGEKGGEVSTTNPAITGKTYGISSEKASFDFYDGIIIGATSQSINGSLNEIEPGYDVIKENREDDTESATLQKLPIARIVSTGKEYYQISDAVLEVPENTKETIQILRIKQTLASDNKVIIGENQDITIDLNGYEISTDIEEFIQNNGKLTITDSSEEVTGKIKSYSTKPVVNNIGAELIIEKGTISATGEIVINNKENLTIKEGIVTGGTNGVKIQENGTLKMTGGKITGTNYGIYNETAGNIEILGGTVKASIGIYNNVEGKVTIENATIGTCGKYGIHNKAGGKIEINSGEVIAHGSYDRGILNEGDGTVIINDGTISSQGNYSSGSWSYYEYPGIAIDNQGTGLVEINGGVIKQIGVGTSTINNKNGTIRVKGGTIEKANYRYGIKNEETGTVQIEGGTLTSAGIGIYNEKTEGVITMTGGTITSKEDGINNVNAGSITITGGTITSENKIGINNASTGKVVIGEEDGEVSITSPAITGKTYGISSTNATFDFYDGVIIGETAAIEGLTGDVEEYYEVRITNGGTKAFLTLKGSTFEQVASIGNVYYDSIKEAVNAVQTSATIKIHKEIELSEQIIIPAGKNITIDLQTNTITYIGDGPAIIIESGARLTIIDSEELGETDTIYSKIENLSGVAIKNEGTLCIGENDGIEYTNSPRIIGSPAIQNTGTLNKYDGVITDL